MESENCMLDWKRGVPFTDEQTMEESPRRMDKR